MKANNWHTNPGESPLRYCPHSWPARPNGTCPGQKKEQQPEDIPSDETWTATWCMREHRVLVRQNVFDALGCLELLCKRHSAKHCPGGVSGDEKLRDAARLDSSLLPVIQVLEESDRRAAVQCSEQGIEGLRILVRCCETLRQEPCSKPALVMSLLS